MKKRKPKAKEAKVPADFETRLDKLIAKLTKELEFLSQNRKDSTTVLIEIKDGVAHVRKQPDGVIVEIHDYDVQEDTNAVDDSGRNFHQQIYGE